ncbi:hypothetical protein [Propionivibrio sp.]|uniref:hypothetical protein n=1 Tax=Propionivibrio sp. TaxID=2212460 RepID=UPI003BF1F77D
MAKAPSFTAETITKNLSVSLEECLLPPDVAAKMLGVSPKWLAALREGRKEIKGPPFIKMGNGKTAPIRYKLSHLLDWIATFEVKTSTIETAPVVSSNFGEIRANVHLQDKWLFAIARDGSSVVEIFTAIANNLFGKKFRYRWLSYAEFSAQRYIDMRIKIDPSALSLLLEAGSGDVSNGLAKLLCK